MCNFHFDLCSVPTSEDPSGKIELMVVNAGSDGRNDSNFLKFCDIVDAVADASDICEEPTWASLEIACQ